MIEIMELRIQTLQTSYETRKRIPLSDGREIINFFKEGEYLPKVERQWN